MATTAEHASTFLFTDIEGSTRLWARAPVAMAAAVQRQEILLREAIGCHHGEVFKSVGDGLYAVFAQPEDAVRAAVAAQRALLPEAWPGFDPGDGLAVRIAVHTGLVAARDGDYFGPPLNRLSRTLAAGHGGQILCTDATLAACGERWPAEIAVRDLGERTLRDVPGSGRIFQVVAPGLPEHFPPLSTLDRRVDNLPRWPSPLIGREEDADRLRRQLRAADARLVTVLGTGGVGKTRLATEVAAQLLDEFQDGIRFVDLSALREDAQVVPGIVQAIGAGDQLMEPRDALLDWLGERQLLLVLDNCEQVVGGVAAIVSDVLSTVPAGVILATSRVPIRVRGERQVTLAPLPLPGVAGPVEANPAMRLFTERAQEVSEHFTLDADSTADVAEICRIVDGLPLAIELAAPWVRVLSPQALQRRLQESRAILRDGARDLPDRQRTLAATIAWSYHLLEPDDQRAFRRLAIFRGGIAVDAAASVIWDESEDDPLWALSRLDMLVQANLLQVSPDSTGEPRFVMLQTIQEFAIDVLWQSGEREATAAAHADFFSRLAAEASEHYGSEDVTRWLDRLDLEFENLRAVIEYYLSAKETGESGLRYVVSLADFLEQRGHVQQERDWLTLMYEDDASYSPALAVDALFRLGNTWFSDPATAEQFYRKAIHVAEASGDDRLRIRPVSALSTVAVLSGHYETALSMAHEVLDYGQRVSDPHYTALGYLRIAHVTCEAGMFERAFTACQEARAYSEQIGDADGEAWGWLTEGRAHRRLGNTALATGALGRAMLRFGETGDEDVAAFCHLEHGLALLDSDLPTARLYLDSATSALAKSIDAYTIICTIEGVARLLIREGSIDAAARLVGAAQHLRERTGIIASSIDVAALEIDIDQATIAVGKTVFDAAVEHGRTYSPHAAIDYYRSVAA